MKKIISLAIGLMILVSCNNSKYEKVEACFNYKAEGLKVEFDNCSTNATDYIWDFGNGNKSFEKNPTFEFMKLQPKIVTLKAYNEEYWDTITHDVSDVILVKKPNIYFYPLEKIDLCVKLSFPQGGNIVKSIPEYKNGWCVSIDKLGKINNKFDYLFYESKQPNKFQHKTGWCIKQNELKSFFIKNMKDYGFSASEINDFIEYWIPLLNKYNYYSVFPQTNEIINRTNQLELSIKADNIFRLFYSVKGNEKFIKLDTPIITPMKRSGFYVVEWGLMKQN